MAYPITLPYPARQPYSLAPQSTVARTDMEAGAGRARRRFRGAPTRIALRWLLTEAQFAVFEAWWSLTALDGTAWQDMPVLNGCGVSSVSARFTGPYRHALAGARHEVTAEIEVRALPQLTAEELEVASAYALDDIAYAAPALHAWLHSTMPAVNYF